MIRILDLVYNNYGKVYNYENTYKFSSLNQVSTDIEKETKFGILDLETYLDQDGNSVVYSAAVIIDGIDNKHAEYGNNQDEILYNLFNHIFNIEKDKKKNK